MSKIQKIKELVKLIYNEKDCRLINEFLLKRQFDNIIELNESEIKKEYRKCLPDKMTDRYCNLMELAGLLAPYDMRDIFPEDNNYYEEEEF